MCVLKMRQTFMDLLVFILLASHVLHIFGKVIVLRGTVKTYYNHPYDRKLICFSEDDEGALVWNDNLISSYYSINRNNDRQFHSVNQFSNKKIDCELNAANSCLESWSRQDWSLTNSFKTPMGPVFDRRWEGFKEYENLEDKYDNINLLTASAAALSLSIRAPRDAHILLCNSKNYRNDLCYWIIIGGWGNTFSVIRKCTSGVGEGTKCKKESSVNHSPMSLIEWRTFVITWDSATRNITVYDNNNIIMTYVDTEINNNSVGGDYHLFIRSDTVMLVRFHIYNFLHTTLQNATLTSPIFQSDNGTICIQLLIGLCTECDAHLVLRDLRTYEVLQTVIVDGSSKAAVHDLPMWQSVKIEKDFSVNVYNNLIIELIPKLNKASSNPLWAIANVRQCPPNGSFRVGVLYPSEDWTSHLKYFWPAVSCQKLFYIECATVNPDVSITQDTKLEDEECPEGRIGPLCSFSCKHNLDSDADCKGTAICYENGCTCSSGFVGSSCSDSCELNMYGFGCRKMCGSCTYKSSGIHSCSKTTGICTEGCDNTRKTYIPPLCQISLDKLNMPTVIFKTTTTIDVVVPMLWKKEYKGMNIFYSFIIKDQISYYKQQNWSMAFENTTQLIGHFEDLKPGITYLIGCALGIEKVYVYSDWQSAETDCNEIKDFDITPGETRLMINWRNNANLLHPCPEHWYHLVARNIDTNMQVTNESPQSFPYNITGLLSFTVFNVTVFHKGDILFSQEVSTLEDVPSEVLGLQRMVTPDPQLVLMWRPPNQPNGKILRYEVIVKVKKFGGCEDLKLQMPESNIITKSTTDTKITILDLRSYTTYIAQVIVHNSRHRSKGTEIPIVMKRLEIPTEVFSQLSIQDWKLTWNMPEDCSMITGPIIARIKIQGISDVVKNVNVTKQTRLNVLELNKIMPPLNGFEKYMATIYVIREYSSPENTSAYKEYIFTTPSTAPPNVNNLEVVEIDTRQSPATIHLRWQSPLPPFNGKLLEYGIESCTNKNCKNKTIQLRDFCDLWDDYICGIIEKSSKPHAEVQVLAYNENVTAPSKTLVTDEMLRNTIPDAPENVTYTIHSNSVIDIKWNHPWRTGDHLQSFHIEIIRISTNLRTRRPRSPKNMKDEYPVTNYTRNYSKRLYLSPSTKYHIYVQAVTIRNISSVSKYLIVSTPSTTAFDGDLDIMVQKFDSTISLNIPSVLNDTKDSTMYIIVKGPHPCKEYSDVSEDLRAQIGAKMYDVVWQAAKVPTNELAGKLFTVGDNKIYGGVRNCLLKPEEMYEITIIVTGPNLSSKSIALAASIRIGEVPPKHHEMWLIPIILCVLVAGTAFYFYRRRRQKKNLNKQLLQDEMALSQNIENYEYEAKSIVINSKQNLSTPSDRQSLSPTITPEVPPIAIDDNDDEDKDMTSLVKVKDFEDYVREAIQSGLLDKQYETFPRGQTRPWEYGKLQQNKSKNRYGNLIAYDDTRVILKKHPNDAYSDYINANYITGYKKKNRYIATQGPKPNTVVDFWRMIWQENVLIICMLANVIENGKTRCEQYWPDIGKKKKYGDVTVLNSKHNVFADYSFRTFQISCGEETRKVEHLHYTAWPDHGVPLYTHSVITYLKKLLATPPGNGPVVVHCSAGVGRTGTIILCDICLHRAAAEGLVDVFAETAKIRSERANMVDNKQQYLLAHLALVECLLSFPTTLPCNEMLPTRIKELKKQLTIQEQRLQNTAWQDEALRQISSPPSLSERNRAKNRFPELILDKINRIYLKRYPASDEDSDYLSAIYVDGVKLQNQYLATQLPMPSTINDFWRMIAEFKVELILMLQPPDLQDSTCCAIAPANGEFKPTSYLNITVKEIVKLEYYTSQKLLLVDKSEKPSREQSVTILCLTEWKSGRNQSPPPVMTMITLWQAAERIARGDGPTAILCHDGVTGCGLYLALSFLLERMGVERECDVCLAVRAVRRSRPDFVRSVEHLEYLYDAALTYLEYFETYANFS